jgi:hypothetical protein
MGPTKYHKYWQLPAKGDWAMGLGAKSRKPKPKRGAVMRYSF